MSAQEAEPTVYTAIPSLRRGAEAAAIVGCSLCGGGFELKARAIRQLRVEGRAPVCRDCRCSARSRDVVVTPTARRWAARTLAAMNEYDRQLVSIGLDSLGTSAPRTDLALAASARRPAA